MTNREERYHKVSQNSSHEGICCSVNYCRSKTRAKIASLRLTVLQGMIWTSKAHFSLRIPSFEM